jgi:hypothetical protein
MLLGGRLAAVARNAFFRKIVAALMLRADSDLSAHAFQREAAH